MLFRSGQADIERLELSSELSRLQADASRYRAAEAAVGEVRDYVDLVPWRAKIAKALL